MRLEEVLDIVMKDAFTMFCLMIIFFIVVAAWKYNPGGSDPDPALERQRRIDMEKYSAHPPNPVKAHRYNLLYTCDGCGKYSRRHNQELAYWTLKLKGVEVEPMYPGKEHFVNVLAEQRLEMSTLSLRDSFTLFRDPEWFTTRVCPTCLHGDKLRLSDDDYPWIATLPEAMELDPQGIDDFVAARNSVKEAIKEMESIDAFKKYHKLDENEKTIEQLLKKRG